MKITSKQHKDTLKYLKPKPLIKFNLPERSAFSDIRLRNYELSGLGEKTLRRLIAVLPSSSGFLGSHSSAKKVRNKAKTTLLHLARPHLNPEQWPKVFRKINNNSRSGLRDFGGGQLGVLNDKAMSVPLRGKFSWTQTKFGELIIMGHWSDISKAIGDAGDGLSFELDFGDIYAGDVNIEFDRMYTDREDPKDDMEIVVTCIPGVAFETTDEEGRVVLNPRGEIVELVGGMVGGFAGAGVALTGPLEVIGLVTDSLGLGADLKDKFGVTLKTGTSHKDKFTFVVAYYQIGTKYRCRKTGEKVVTGPEFLEICKDLAQIS